MRTDNTVLIDGKPVTLEQVDERLQVLANESGEVWYYRERPADEVPPSNAGKVIELVIKHGLSISMSSKPDFSDYVDDEGRSRPR